MKNGVQKLIFVFLGLVTMLCIFLLSKSTHVQASQKDGKKFEDWSVNCNKEDPKANISSVCLLSQQINITQDNTQQPLALYQIGYIGPQKELKLIITLPLGVRLDAGTSIISSKKLIAPGKFTVCTQSGCQAVSPVSEEDIKNILSSTDSTIAFMNMEGKQVAIPFSTKGLAEGLKFIK